MKEADANRCEDQPAGLDQSWPATVEAMLGPIYRFVRARAPADAVDDLVQETFVAATRGIGGFNGRCPLWNWLTAIARNKIVQHYRRTGLRNVLVQALGVLNSEEARIERALADGSPLPDEICERREFQVLARAALSGLSPEHQVCLVGRYDEDLSLAELARRFEITPSLANTRLYRARQALRQSFLGLLGSRGDMQESLP